MSNAKQRCRNVFKILVVSVYVCQQQYYLW